MSRPVAMIVVAVGFAGGFNAVAAAAPEASAGRQQRIALVGCVAQTANGGFELTNAMRASMARRTGGSNSAKASTPIGTADASAGGPRTRGAATAKGSAPIRVVPASLTTSATSGANSPKGSTPVAQKPLSYTLTAADSDVASFIGRAVEVVGVLGQRALNVETVRPIAGSCAR